MSQICGKCETDLHDELDCKACGQRHLRCENCGDAVMAFLSFCPTCSKLMEEPLPPVSDQAKTVKMARPDLSTVIAPMESFQATAPSAQDRKQESNDDEARVKAAEELLLLRSTEDLETRAVNMAPTPTDERPPLPKTLKQDLVDGTEAEAESRTKPEAVPASDSLQTIRDEVPEDLEAAVKTDMMQSTDEVKVGASTVAMPERVEEPDAQTELPKTVIHERPYVPPKAPEAGVHRYEGYLDPRDYVKIFQTCQDLIKRGYKLYGLFGRPESGKTLFLYALGEMLRGGQDDTVSGYELDGSWKNMIQDQKEALRLGRPAATERGLHIYHAHRQDGKSGSNHLAFLDISGEQFEQIQSWQEEVGAFFVNYLAHCSGYMIFLDIDEDIIDPFETVRARYQSRLSDRRIEEIIDLKKSQMENIKNFLAVAAAIPKVKKLKHLEVMRRLEGARARTNKLGKSTIAAPICLAVSKADRFRKMKFDGFPKIIPGGEGPYGDPWDLIQKLWPGHLKTILNNAPQLKISWLSSLGADWQPGEMPGAPMGMDTIFRHLITNPPPRWGLSTRRYRQIRSIFGL